MFSEGGVLYFIIEECAFLNLIKVYATSSIIIIYQGKD